MNATFVLISNPLTLLMDLFKLYWHFLTSNGLVIVQLLAPIFWICLGTFASSLNTTSVTSEDIQNSKMPRNERRK
jgi:hypothetical protein